MPIDEQNLAPWTRKHDDPRSNLFDQVAKIVYPNSLEELITLCQNRPPDQRFKAAGSHWALSASAISDHTFIETNDPGNVHRAMGRTLTNVIPACITSTYVQHMVDSAQTQKSYLVHVEAGKRIYQLYAELDQKIAIPDPDADNPTLAGIISRDIDHNDGRDVDFSGPWAFSTLGGAGGQTIVGAINTGTHGGDFARAPYAFSGRPVIFNQSPIADSVLAIHLVADGGKHYWIEAVSEAYPQLTDDDKLNAIFRSDQYGGHDNFEIIRDNNMFDAVLVSAGRFGVIYSVILQVVPQYSMLQRRRKIVWQDIKHQIKETKDRNSTLYKDSPSQPPLPDQDPVPTTSAQDNQRFLQIVICLTPHHNFQRNWAGVTKRWNLELPDIPQGRKERVGEPRGFNERIQGFDFTKAGANYPYTPNERQPQMAGDISFLHRACSNASFVKAVLDKAINEIEEFIQTNGVAVGAGIAAIASTGGAGLLALIPALAILLLILRELLEHFNDDTRLGEVMETIKNRVLEPENPDPLRRAAGVFVWQLIADKIFDSMQGDQDFEAISYAVLDQKNYLDRSCEVNVDSVEVSFDAVDDRLIAFIDALIAFEIAQELNGKAFVGYASLRFMGRSRALLGMQKFETTCAVEVAGLKDVSGSQDLVDYAVKLALNPNINGLLHWGQRNDYKRRDVEFRYGADLITWRAALARITKNGQLDGFSSEFTRRTGLEVV